MSLILELFLNFKGSLIFRRASMVGGRRGGKGRREERRGGGGRREQRRARQGRASRVNPQWAAEPVRSVEGARLGEPTAFSGAEGKFSDWDFALTCFVGTMYGTLLKEPQAVASDPRVKRTPTDEARKERARLFHNILALLTTKGPRKTV